MKEKMTIELTKDDRIDLYLILSQERDRLKSDIDKIKHIEGKILARDEKERTISFIENLMGKIKY